MPPCYDIYGLSKQRDKKTIEQFLTFFSYRDNIENREGQEIALYKNERYEIDGTFIPVKTLTEVIDWGLKEPKYGFAFYIGDNLKEGISCIVLKFTFDSKIIFGISIEENTIDQKGKLVSNYRKALEIEKSIKELTNSFKTSIQSEHAPADDEIEFDDDMQFWSEIILKNSPK